MNEFDDRVRSAGERVRQRAATISRDVSPKPPRGAEVSPGGVDSHARRWSLAAAVLVASAGVVAVGLVATSGGDETRVPAIDSASTMAGTDDDLSAAASTTEATPEPTTAPTVPATSATPTSVPSSEPPATTVPATAVSAGFERPIIDPDVCAPRAAWESGPITTDSFTLFARPSELPVPIQIIGDPDAGESKPFALVQRYFGEPDNYAGSASETVDINGTPVRVGAYPNGNGEALWVLDDGSEAYLRSRGLGRHEIIRIVSGLDPRSNNADIPGFDYTPQPSDIGTLELVAEQMNTTISFSGGVGSQCDVAATGFTYRLDVFDGDPVARFASIIDRPPPLDVGVIGDRVAMISGPTDATAPSVSDIVAADEAFWFDLRSRATFEEASGMPTAIGGANEVLVRLEPVGAQPRDIGYLTVRMIIKDDVPFLEVDSIDTATRDGELWEILVNGNLRYSATAHPGAVLGVRLANTPLTEPFTATIRTVDPAGETTSTTRELQLLPVS